MRVRSRGLNQGILWVLNVWGVDAIQLSKSILIHWKTTVVYSMTIAIYTLTLPSDAVAVQQTGGIERDHIRDSQNPLLTPSHSGQSLFARNKTPGHEAGGAF